LDELGVTDDATVRGLDEWRQGYNLPFGYWDVADPDAGPALRACRAAGVRAGVISNSNGSIRAILEKVGLAPHLDFVLDSSEVGAEKPDPRIFRLALETAGATAAEAVHVGDLYSVDVLGARGAGIEAVLLDPGRCWGERDCVAAAGPLDAVHLILARRRATREA
ncbi:MAG: HAD-IA family hydrolase, partial [Candidatus Rokuibacteriota bacterium]